MLKELENFKEKGSFTFSAEDDLFKKCNAPKDGSGIYLIFADDDDEDNLLYIGISGSKGEDGEIVHEKDGIYGTLVNGKQFGLDRKLSWPLKMLKDEIELIVIKWYVTYGKHDNRFPRPIEEAYLILHQQDNFELPPWNFKI